MAYQSVQQAPLLPASLRDRLGRWLLRAGGSALLMACGVCSVALLTWSSADPSFSHVTSGAIRNILGSPGAILSDLLIQLLGLCGVLVVLPPLLWSLYLSAGQPVPGWRSRVLLAPLAIGGLAGAVSFLPTSVAWSLHHGNGGMIGDLVFTLLAGALAPFTPNRAQPLAAALLLAAGLLSLLGSLGLSREDWQQVLRGRRNGLQRLAGSWRSLRQWLPEPRLPMPAGAAAAFAALHEPRVNGAARVEPTLSPAPVIASAGLAAALDSAPDLPPPASIDDIDPSSRAMAERFAPPGRQPVEPVFADMPPMFVPPDAPARAVSTPVAGEAWRKAAAAGYRRPPLAILKRAPTPKANDRMSQSALMGHARLLTDVLTDFGVKGEIKGIQPGPVVTLFEFEPARGTKTARVIGLADDIARSMSAVSVRVAVVPGRNVIGIELPNPRRDKVYLRELIETEAFRASDAALPLVLGKGIGGAPVFADLARMPHLLVAGTTGAGKSVGVNAMILSLLYRLAPEECRFLMIDPKMLELSVYNGIPHLLCPVVTDPHKAVAALDWVVREMESRYERMSKLGVRNIDAFNARARHAARRGRAGGADDLAPLPYIVVVVDEFADLMLVAGKEIEGAVQRLAQMARAAGIHLIMATQRPSVDVITGTIKANFPTRISFKVASKFDSRTILNDQGAEQLLGQGDMLFSGGADRLMRVHGPFVSDEEVEGIAAYLRDQGEPRYIPGITDVPEPAEEGSVVDLAAQAEELYDRAVGIVLRDGKPSISYLQRRLAIGYNRAAALVERMEQEGVISPMGEGGRRQVLLGGRAAVRHGR
jgi:S-DNA-T family DNA segregation ATPase FtsK/SpoIIIE